MDRRNFLGTAALLGAAIGLPPARASNAPLNREPHMARSDNGLSDFDFLVGEWRLHHRRLKERLAGSTTWEEFEGTSSARKILGGLGNMDDNWIDLPGGAYHGASVRLFDPATGLWRIWWFDARTPAIPLDPPVAGRFENGVGTFLTKDTFKGRPIIVRFIWSDITPTSARWSQAFSPDDGKTWETNWTNTLTRTA
jgi:hypothetical protein